MLRSLLQFIAFVFPRPVNIWLHRLAGGRIGKHVSLHPGVLIFAKNIEIANFATIKFGTMINVRSFKLGRKSSIGFFTLVNGVSDLIIEDACVIGARSMINCDRPVTFRYYSGNGPGCYIYTHGSFLPVTEGYHSTFAPVEIKQKVWIQMNCKIGPGVTIGEGSVIMPGTVVLENIAPQRMVVGDPAKMVNVPLLRQPVKMANLKKLAHEILNEYCKWSNEYKGTNWKIENGALQVVQKGHHISISIDDEGDIVLLTQNGAKRDGMYFNLFDLTTDEGKHPLKPKFEEYMRLHYGLIFI